ncbi:MAG: tellurium resistance protein TerC, partial [Myxococcota bacterium]
MDTFTVANFLTLGMLVLLQAVLGFDNLLYISIESKKAPVERQASARKKGLVIAIVLRIVLLFAVIQAFDAFNVPFFKLHKPGIFEADVNVQAFVTLIGGGFIVYTAFKEIAHMLAVDDLEGGEAGGDR